MIKGIGCDIVEIDRINLKIAKNVLFGNELIEFEKSNRKEEFLASRFAAKEAIVKATNKKYLFKDIELLNSDSGELSTNIKGVKVSISHEKKNTIAFAIWELNE